MGRAVRRISCVAIWILTPLIALISACAEENPRSLTNGAERPPPPENSKAPPVPGESPRPSLTAKEHFLQNVHTSIATSCGARHAQGPGPTWVVPTDGERSYGLQFERGYVAKPSAILAKGAHSGGPALTNAQATSYLTWVELEMKERGDNAPESVLTRLSACLDPIKFEAIGFNKLVTTPRNAGNNPQKQEENTDECIGCNKGPCSTCHSADPGSGFVMALGNDLFPADHTFRETKSWAPPYLQKYFGLDPTGMPMNSKAVRVKSDVTVKTGKAYSHPMFTLTPEMEKAIDLFVNDAIDKYKTGRCGS